MLKHAADLSDSHEYFIVWAGGTNARPWGTKAQAHSLFPDIELARDGLKFANINLPSNGNRLGGAIERGLAITLPAETPALKVNEFTSTIIRLGTNTAPVKGVGTVVANTATTVDVLWHTNLTPGTSALDVPASITRGGRRASAYHNVRVLTPYLAVNDETQNHLIGSPSSASSFSYAGAGGRSVTLPAPFSGSTGTVSAPATGRPIEFTDMGVFLPFTFLEGIDGYGISEFGDAAGSFSVSCTSSNPMVVTKTNHGLSDGDIVAFHEDTTTLPQRTTPFKLRLQDRGVPTSFVVTNKTDHTFTLRLAGTATASPPYGPISGEYASSSTGTDVRMIQQHKITDITSATWTFTNALPDSYLLNGGYIIVDWEDSGVMKRSWSIITNNPTSTTFSIAATAYPWLGDGAPTSAVAVKRYTAWQPNFNDNPHSYLPGEGYTYPNNDISPYPESANGAAIHNRPRGLAGHCYGDRFGEMLTGALRLSASIGKRVNVVLLGFNQSGLVPSSARTSPAHHFSGYVSGFTSQQNSWSIANEWPYDWGVTRPTGLAFGSKNQFDHLTRLLTTVLPNALKAESSTKTLRCLGIVFLQGEEDALDVSSKQHYGSSLRAFIVALRNLINKLGYNPYANGAEIPYVQPRIAHIPYELDGTYNYFGVSTAIAGDTDGLVNSAIEENTAADAFAASVKVDDLPRIVAEPGVYNGVGEAELGARISDKLGGLIDYALGHGSLALSNTQTRLVEICNLALSFIGDSGLLTSLEDGSEQATLCKRFLPEARDGLLQMRQWGFAMRRRALVRIQKLEGELYQHFNNCYVLPEDALNAFAVLPAVVVPDQNFDYEEVLTSSYSSDFAANDGSGTAPKPVQTKRLLVVGGGLEGGVTIEPDSLLPILSNIELDPVPFTVEQSPFGHRYIFTNENYATLQYVARVVDADQYSPQFTTALACYLGSMLAGVIVKGDQGEAVSARLLQKAAGFIRSASSSDARQQRPVDSHRPFGFVPDHLANR